MYKADLFLLVISLTVMAIEGIFIPFIGTALGAAFVFFMKKEISSSLTRFLSGFAAGVMTAASIWSLLLPAIDSSSQLGFFAFLPAALGFFLGVAALLLTDLLFPNDLLFRRNISHRTTMLVLAVTAHNLPEGVAVGAVWAALLADSPDSTLAGALALSLGIGLQNLPEGAIISMPLYSSGTKKLPAFLVGVLSGIVEPIGAAAAILAAKYLFMLPYLLSFAAGAMVYVVVEELIPEITSEKGGTRGIISFALGFLLMMSLDVALG